MMSVVAKPKMALERRCVPPVGFAIASEDARRDGLKRFYNLRASEEVCPQTPKQPP